MHLSLTYRYMCAEYPPPWDQVLTLGSTLILSKKWVCCGQVVIKGAGLEMQRCQVHTLITSRSCFMVGLCLYMYQLIVNWSASWGRFILVVPLHYLFTLSLKCPSWGKNILNYLVVLFAVFNVSFYFPDSKKYSGHSTLASR